MSYNPHNVHISSYLDNEGGFPEAAPEKTWTSTVFTKEQVLDIYRRVWAGERGADLAEEFGVSKQRISSIKHGDQFADVTEHDGQGHHRKLTEKEIKDIYRAAKKPNTKRRQVAEQYGVTKQTVSHIALGQTHAKITGHNTR